jgi:hypothetical protein
MKEKIATGWKTLSGSLSFAKYWISEFLETDSYHIDLEAVWQKTFSFTGT